MTATRAGTEHGVALDKTETHNEEVIALLEDVMTPLRRHYERPDVSEIAVCAPGIVFHRLREHDRFGRVWRGLSDRRLTHSYLILAMTTIANLLENPFDPRIEPALHTELPGGHRVCGLAGNSAIYDKASATMGGVSLCIRQGSSDEDTKKRELSDWSVDDDGQWRRNRSTLSEAMHIPKGTHEALFEAAYQGRPMLFSGPTNSGKTTLLNRLLMEVDEDVRVITVEDTRELIVWVPNRLHIKIPRERKNAQAMGLLDPEGVRNVVVRSTPDAVLIGEISPANAGLAVQLLQTGHHHCWTSIHAGSPDEAIGEFAALAAGAEAERTKDEIEKILSEKFIIVQTQITGGQRRISDIRYPEGAQLAEGLEQE